MKRQLKKKERYTLYTAGVIVVLILLWITWINPMRTSIGELSGKIQTKKDHHKAVTDLKNDYLQTELDIRKYTEIISRRPENFSLERFISSVENELSFPSRSSRPTESRKQLSQDYVRTKITYQYQGKTLGEIVDFLYRIEDPVNAIIINHFSLTPSKAKRGAVFDMSLRLMVVTREKE